MREDKQLLLVLHLSQLLDLVTGIGGTIVPIIIWSSKKDEIFDMDEHGKAVINFRISMLIYILLSVPLTFLFCLGVFPIIIIGILSIIYPILNAVRVNDNQAPNYPFSIQFLK